MTFTVTPNLVDIDLAESATPWTTGSLDPAKFKQGSNSIGWYAGKNARSVNGVSSKSINWTTGDHLYWWNASDVIAVAEPQTTGTTTASGVTIRVTLANGAYREWHVAGSDTWDGGWRCFVVDLGHTGSHLYASSGSWTDLSNITDVDIYIDLSNSGNIRNVPANNFADAIRVGTGVAAYNTSAADPAFDFADIAAVCEADSQQYGITETKDGVIFLQGALTLGAATTNHLDFDSQGEVVVFSLRDGTDGFGIVADGLYRIDVVGNATGTDQDFNMGVKVGTGDTATGRTGTQILSGAAGVRWEFDALDVNLHSVTIYGSTLQGAYTSTTTTAVVFGTVPATQEIAGTTFDGCGVINFGDVVLRNINVLNSVAASTTGAMLWSETSTDIKNSLFVNNSNAISVTSLSGDMTFDGMDFSGNTYDVRYNESGSETWDLNWSNAAAAPTINNVDTSILTAVNSVIATFTPLENGSAFTITKNSDNSVLKDVTSVTGGEVTYSYDGSLNGTAATVHIIVAGKEPIDFPWTLAEGTVPVSQVTDRIYSNP